MGASEGDGVLKGCNVGAENTVTIGASVVVVTNVGPARVGLIERISVGQCCMDGVAV